METLSPDIAAALRGRLPYGIEVLTDRPLNWWRLAESTGTTATDLGSGNKVGTYTNSPTLGVPGALHTDPDTGVQFPTGAPAKYVNIATYTTVPSPATIEAWINGASFQDMGVAGWFDNSGANANFYIYITSSGTQTRLVSGAGTNDTQWDSSGQYAVGVWHQLVGTYDGTVARLYHNGVQVVGPITKTAAGGTANTTFKIANYGSPSGTAFNGSIDEVAVYNYALPAERVLAHYRAAGY